MNRPGQYSPVLQHESSANSCTYVPVLLVIYLVFLAGLAGWSVGTQTPVIIRVPETPDEIWLVRWGKQMGCTALRDFLVAFPIGFLVAGSVARSTRTLGVIGLIVSLVVGICVAICVALAVRVAINGMPPRRPTLQAIAFAAVCCAIGCWAGATWVRSKSSIGWFAGQTFLLLMFIAAVVGGFVWYGLEPTPLEFESVALETEDRRRLAKLFQENNPRKIEPGETAEMTLTSEDLNQLIAWGLALVSRGQKAQVEIEPGNVSVALSTPLPEVVRLDRFLNVLVAGDVIAEQGRLGVAMKSVRIGRIKVPPALLAIGGPAILDEAWHNKHTRPFLTSMREIELASGQATVTYGHVDVSSSFLRDALVDLGGMENMAPATAAHVEHLFEQARADGSRFDFGRCLETAMRFAQERSTDGDAVQENRAAILALGYLVGHRRIKTFVGPELPSMPSDIRAQFRSFQLRNREDWARHFTVSAALTVLSNVAASDSVGLLKEELDADGGSGFSFPDLLADRTGTTFAERSIGSESMAREMQSRLAAGFDLDAFFPPAADLPEGLTDAQLNSEFGGVGGPGYEEVVQEIERRIASCTAYQSAP